MPTSATSFFGNGPARSLAEPLSRRTRIGLLAGVVFFHVGGGWALTQIAPARMIIGEATPLEVRLVAPEEPEALTPPEPVPDLAAAVAPPEPDLPPPVFPVEAKPTKPPEPPPPKPQPKPVQRPQAPVEAAAAPPPPPVSAEPKSVSISQVGYLVRPNPIYPSRARRAGEQGTATVRVLIDMTGRPTNVSLDTPSGHAALDEAALSAVRAAQFRPYAEGGIAQPVWVLIPITFKLE